MLEMKDGVKYFDWKRAGFRWVLIKKNRKPKKGFANEEPKRMFPEIQINSELTLRECEKLYDDEHFLIDELGNKLWAKDIINIFSNATYLVGKIKEETKNYISGEYLLQNLLFNTGTKELKIRAIQPYYEEEEQKKVDPCGDDWDEEEDEHWEIPRGDTEIELIVRRVMDKFEVTEINIL